MKTTISGKVIDTSHVRTQYGLVEPFETNLRSGVPLWLHYVNKELVSVECKEEEKFYLKDTPVGNGE